MPTRADQLARHGRPVGRNLWLAKNFDAAIAKAATAKGLTLSEIVQTALRRAHQVDELQAEVARPFGE